jgi:hypothetical protein
MNCSLGSTLLATVLVSGLPETLNAQVLFTDNFDSFSISSTITSSGSANGYTIYFSAASGLEDFTATFGFDYSTVNLPVSIPPAPHSTGGTTKGLYLTVNKADTTAAAAAVNLYPLNQSFNGNYSLKFDVWMQPGFFATTEHALFGINHSGVVTNQIGKGGSDGLLFGMDGDGGASSTASTLRDFVVLQGRGANTPFLMLTNNSTFGPAPLLGDRFDNGDPGFTGLFPSTPANGSNPAGSPCYRWVTGEVRQDGSLITWLLDDTIVAQYPNNTAYTSGNILLGYNDTFNSIGQESFAILDNIRVEAIPEPSVLTQVEFGGCALLAWGLRRRKR